MKQDVSLWRRFVVPGLVFQAVLSGGGYATGREIWEYIARFGTNGLAGTAVIAVGFFVVLFLSGELARRTASFNYRRWSKELLGVAWPLFDLLFVAMAVIAIAVVTSAATSVATERANVPYTLASILIIAVIAVLASMPRRLLERYEASGAVLLTILYVFVAFFASRGAAPVAQSDAATPVSGWLVASVLYVGYNLVVVPTCLFTFDRARNRADVAIASAVAAMIACVPILLRGKCVLA